ncbi:unnamed protein product [Peronospora destructor]|uniref:Small integral membrane protein 15 n=1 Tax=Peronospora destructor TaxID=86335 RepID=A0AAV0V547_9STRA|nr:unnamed protein product [Peronospora destructor]
MSNKDDVVAKLRARMAQPPKDWVDVVMVKVLKDPVYYGVLGFSVFFALATMALFATKILLNQIAIKEKQKKRQVKKEKKKEQ